MSLSDPAPLFFLQAVPETHVLRFLRLTSPGALRDTAKARKALGYCGRGTSLGVLSYGNRKGRVAGGYRASRGQEDRPSLHSAFILTRRPGVPDERYRHAAHLVLSAARRPGVSRGGGVVGSACRALVLPAQGGRGAAGNRRTPQGRIAAVQADAQRSPHRSTV